MMWSEKNRPQNISEMVGNEEARSALVEWFGKWKKGTKPILLVGPPGIGKTTIAGLAAKQFGYDLISLNASDVRSKSRINEILTPLLGNISILGSPMIFVDEVDGIHGRSDYGVNRTTTARLARSYSVGNDVTKHSWSIQLLMPQTDSGSIGSGNRSAMPYA